MINRRRGRLAEARGHLAAAQVALAALLAPQPNQLSTPRSARPAHQSITLVSPSVIFVTFRSCSDHRPAETASKTHVSPESAMSTKPIDSVAQPTMSGLFSVPNSHRQRLFRPHIDERDHRIGQACGAISLFGQRKFPATFICRSPGSRPGPAELVGDRLIFQGQPKQPHYITAKDGSPLAFDGLPTITVTGIVR